MITNRPLEKKDLPMLQAAIDQNTFHTDQKVGYFTGDDVCSEVYEDEKGPIGVLCYTKVLRLSTAWCKNDDYARNGASTIQAIRDAVELAKSGKYTQVIFETCNPVLERFCISKFGFKKSEGNTMVLYT